MFIVENDDMQGLFGIGLADVRAMREHQFGQGVEHVQKARKLLEGPVRDAQNEVSSQGIDPAQISIVQTAHIRPPCPSASWLHV